MIELGELDPYRQPASMELQERVFELGKLVLNGVSAFVIGGTLEEYMDCSYSVSDSSHSGEFRDSGSCESTLVADNELGRTDAFDLRLFYDKYSISIELKYSETGQPFLVYEVSSLGDIDYGEDESDAELEALLQQNETEDALNEAGFRTVSINQARLLAKALQAINDRAIEHMDDAIDTIKNFANLDTRLSTDAYAESAPAGEQEIREIRTQAKIHMLDIEEKAPSAPVAEYQRTFTEPVVLANGMRIQRINAALRLCRAVDSEGTNVLKLLLRGALDPLQQQWVKQSFWLEYNGEERKVQTMPMGNGETHSLIADLTRDPSADPDSTEEIDRIGSAILITEMTEAEEKAREAFIETDNQKRADMNDEAGLPLDSPSTGDCQGALVVLEQLITKT